MTNQITVKRIVIEKTSSCLGNKFENVNIGCKINMTNIPLFFYFVFYMFLTSTLGCMSKDATGMLIIQGVPA